ncbi:MAG: Lon protease family protein [Sandaracinaceae bacterium]
MNRPPIKPIEPARARRSCDATTLTFETTDELEPLEGLLGQLRAERAIEFGLTMSHKGFNLFVLGPPGTGKHRLVRDMLSELGVRDAPKDDVVYTHRFGAPDRPRALVLPAGRGAELDTAMTRFVRDLPGALRAAFEADGFRDRVRSLEQALESRGEQAIKQVSERAEQKSIRLMRTPTGFGFAPLKDGEPLDPAAFAKLPEEEQAGRKAALEELEEALREALEDAPRWQREARDALRTAQREEAVKAAHALLSEARRALGDLAEVTGFLDAVTEDVGEMAPALLAESAEPEGDEAAAHTLAMGAMDPLARYRVNLLVDRRDEPQPLVVEEDHPTFDRLFGSIDQRAHLGALVSDHTMIRAGALHRANGGTLIVDAQRLLRSPAVWDSLKRALTRRTLEIESASRSLGFSAGSLSPDPIPLDVKIVLIGDRELYYALSGADPDFEQLFKVPADLSDDVAWTAEHELEFARLLTAIARSESLLPLRRCAVARMLEHASRLAEDQHKLSTALARTSDLMREADWHARRRRSPLVTREHVLAAIAARHERDGRIAQATLERFGDGTVLVDTDGAVVGQINGLSVLAIGHSRFGQPNRISCRVRLGGGEIIDIEREAKLGGAIHSKGVMILSSFLGATYAEDRPLSLTASLVFEQSYGGVDGDSASMAELCALLSALSEIPIQQRFAITGSVDQRGRAQVIGGVNEKIEGFYAVCAARGLDGTHAVLIPDANVRHLMLSEEVVDAIAQGKFSVYPYRDVDEAIALLTGTEAGTREGTNAFRDDTVHGRVEHKLIELSDHAMRFSRWTP